MIGQNYVAGAALVSSVVFHVWVFSAVPEVRASSRELMASSVEFQVVEDHPPEPEPEPEPEIEPPPPPPPAPEPEPETEPEPEPEVIESEPEQAAPEPEAEPAPAAPELTGETLANEGAGWSAPQGSGRERNGPLRAGVSRPSRAHRPAKPTPPPPPRPRPQPVAALPLSKLSRPPEPPSLGGALKRNYPSQARAQGKGGEAKVRARIEASGTIRVAKVVGETSAGFGAACKKTLLASRWSVPLDKDGKPVATWVSYRCQFRIDE